MASVRYKIYTRILAKNGENITNDATQQWVGIFDKRLKNEDYSNTAKYSCETVKFVHTEEDVENLKDLLMDSMDVSNPKYGMIFIYKGLEVIYEENTKGLEYTPPAIEPNSNASKEFKDFLLRDTFERIYMQPWFYHSTHNSLKSAMEVAEALVKKLGVKNVKIGKEVPLDLYLDIV